MISAIEECLDVETLKLDSHKQRFYLNMFEAWKYHHITPNEFRNISSSDYRAINQIDKSTCERLKVHNEQEQVKAKMEQELMMRRMNYG